MKKNLNYLVLLILVIAGPIIWSGPVSSKLLTFDKKMQVTDESRLPDKARSFYSGRAKENLLGLTRSKPFSLPKSASRAGAVDTITIIALRISFQTEVPNDPTTTGNGSFDLRDTIQFLAQEGHLLDPAPHNKHYFESHLRSLSHYWKVVSNGKLHLEYEVWPPDDSGSYLLDEPMVYYGAQQPNFGLGEFFHDALNKAYSVDGGSINWRDSQGRKKAVLLFHAGSDRQTDLWFSATPTPNDLFTGFATFDEGAWVIFPSDTIKEGVILPETMTQDNRVTVMNAVIAHEFGHQLGLVDLYNTGSNPFLTQLGDFALMDNNGMNTAAVIDTFGVGVFGTVPLFPMAWSRAYLGFDEVVEFEAGTSIELAAVKMETSETKIGKIPISATEYYLLENRRGDVDGNLDGLRQDSSSFVVLWPVIQEFVVNGNQLDTILTPVREYDIFIADDAAGLAVWHIDEMAAAMDYFPFDNFSSNFDANSLQWDPLKRFVSLVEADGSIDFGGIYSRGYGNRRDLFYSGNNDLFSGATNPPTLSHDMAYTHIKLSNISAPAMTMTFDLSQEKMADGWPRRTGLTDNPDLSPVIADIDNDGASEILIVSGRRILAIESDGRDYMDPLAAWNDFDTIISPIVSGSDVNFNRPIDTTFAQMPVFAELSMEITTNPVVATFNDTTLIMVGTDAGIVFSYLPYTSANSGSAQFRGESFELFRLSGGGDISAIMTDTANNLIYGFYDSGKMLVVPWDSSVAGAAEATYDFGGEFISVCRYSDGLAVVVEQSGQTVLFMTRMVPVSLLVDSLIVDNIIISETGFHSIVASDFDRNGDDEIVLISALGHILGFSFTDLGIEPYIPFDLHTSDSCASRAAVADINGDGFTDLFVPGVNRVYGYDRNGLTLTDFPVVLDAGRAGQLVVSGPIISDVSGDKFPDIIVTAVDSVLYNRSLAAFYEMPFDTINFPDSMIRVDTTITYAYYNLFTNLYAISPGERRIDGWPVPAAGISVRQVGGPILRGAGTPAHLKAGNDGLVISVGSDGWMYGWKSSWSDNESWWRMAGRQPGGGSFLSQSALGLEVAESEFVPEKSFYNYPNPVTGDQTHIRYYLNQPAVVTITIFDEQGDKVEEMTRQVVDGNRHDEVIWNVSDVASGIYHCRLEVVASSGGEIKVAFKTIAVVR